jgi:hypothetical protein
VATSTAFEIYSIDPDEIETEINNATKRVFPLLCAITEDESLTAVSGTYEYAVPATIIGDPHQIYLEPTTTTDPWIKLLDWNYDAAGHNIRFNYQLTADYSLRLIGLSYLSQVSDDDDTIELDEPQVQLIYAMVVMELYRALAAGEIGTDGEKYQKQVARWEQEVEELQETQGMVLPNRTLKISGWVL